MSTLINLVISFIMGVLFGHQMEEPKTAHIELKKQSIEIFQQLESRQQILEC
ncbi:hypothetical protein [Gramella sp. MAR_2010_147]|uniref:hypothetical protein n=1 Tax=Gramella sp. MAR_2010_147 TaxID=1250205 RepID=UPI00087C5450|nr:hypothetical protein [Gramella sp. MAR_2010_147]SDR89551.1 hypothetical protein SAMN04488553_0972 [Gramella sp. MAR_2010_147]